MKKYKWNKKKCFKNIFNLFLYLFGIILESIMFGLIILGFCGIDYVL